MKKIFSILILMSVFTLTGCFGVIDQGNVGVRTAFGDIEAAPVEPGMYTSFLSSVDIYTTKEVAVNLKGLTPKAQDNLKMEKLDLTLYYTVRANALPNFQASFTGMSQQADGNDFYYPGYVMVHDAAQSSTMDSVASFESLKIHQQRSLLEESIKSKAQALLNQAAPNTFTVTRVLVTTADTDKTIEQSIQNNIMADKDLETARKQVEIRKQNGLANEALSVSLTPAFLQHEYNQVLGECARSAKCTLIVDGSTSPKVIPLNQEK